MPTCRLQKYLATGILMFISLLADAKITIVGTTDCGAWASSRKANDQQMQEWLLVFLTALLLERI